MNLFELITMGIIDALGYTLISYRLLYSNFQVLNIRKRLNTFFTALLFSTIMGIYRFYFTEKYSIIVSGMLLMLYLFILYRKSFKETFFLYIISTIIWLMTQYLTLTLIKMLDNELDFTFKNGIISQLITLLLVYITTKKVQVQMLYNNLLKGNRVFNYIIYNIFVLLIAILLYMFLDMEGAIKNVITISVLSIGLVLVNFILINDKLKIENEKQKTMMYEKYLPIIDELMNEIRAKQHEFDNHIQSLHMLATVEGNCEEINYSIKDYIEDIDLGTDTRSLLKLDNKVLAGFLFSKIKKSREKSIRFYINIEEYGFKTCLKDYELIEIIGNLIDNSFETDVEDNIVMLTLKKEGDMNVIEIKNKHPYLNNDLIKYMFTPGYSTKSSSKRGYGLSNIRDILNKNDGYISLSNQSIDGGNYVVFKILIR